MRLDLRRPVHLTYCLNVHAGETWRENEDAIRSHVCAVRDRVAPDGAFGLGLRLSNAASLTLEDTLVVAEFLAFMARNDLYAFTVNAFPFGTFHGSAVKEGAYRPDWRTQERVAYTKRVATVLARLLPEGVNGSISTVPLSYRPWGISDDDRRLMVRHLLDVACHLDELAETTGADIALALEPEPDCVLEKTEDVIAFFDRLPLAGTERARFVRRVGVCFDTCHSATQFENPTTALRRIADAGIRIPKVQLSAALRATDGPATRRALRRFCDPVYLHQVRCRRKADGEVTAWADLAAALDAAPPGMNEWRVHCHVPLYYEGEGDLRTTADDLTPGFFATLLDADVRHVEVETYTFDVLPAAARSGGVDESVANELRWAEAALRAT